MHKLKEKKTRTRADSRLLNLLADVRRLRRDGETFPATCWYHLAQRLEAQCSGNLTLYLTYVRGEYKWETRAPAKCISQRSRGGRTRRARAILKPFAGKIIPTRRARKRYKQNRRIRCVAASPVFSPRYLTSLPARILPVPLHAPILPPVARRTSVL